MAVMDLQYGTKNAREMTPLEQSHARLVGSLMVCAKLLQRATLNESIGKPQETIHELVHVLVSLGGLYQGDGQRMESEALALDELLGFHIEQHYIASSAGGVH